MEDKPTLTRRETEEFARRIRKNLHFIIEKRDEGEDVHEVTQLVASLLGLIVFPYEAKALKSLESKTLVELEGEGWPRWKVLKDDRGDCEDLETLVWHLRNAAAHRRIRFSSDRPEMGRVEIVFEDAPKDKPVNWRASINAAELKKFCDRFEDKLIALVE
jgi:hypothetical protein